MPVAVQKGQYVARRNLIRVPISEPGTIPHEVLGEHGTSRVMLKPAGPGTGVIAGSVPRAIVELAGYRNLLTKELGSRNQTNVAYAVMGSMVPSSYREVAAVIQLGGAFANAIAMVLLILGIVKLAADAPSDNRSPY